MDIDVRKLKFSGKTELDFSFEYNLEENLLMLPDAYVDGPIIVSGTLELHEDDCYVDGEINCKIVGICARCLEKAEYNYAESFSVKYVRNNPNLEEFEYLYKSGVVNLREVVNEMLMINLPQTIYCKENCKGCGGCYGP